MIHSMTAFARRGTDTPWGTLTWELRSVNHRYLELGMRLPEELRALEPRVRELMQARLKRGKVDAGLWFTRAAATDAALDAGQVRRLQELAASAQREAGAALAPLRALDELADTRAREGARLQELLLARLMAMEKIVAGVHAVLPEMARLYRERLEARLKEVREGLDPARLEQEMVLFANRTDVAEELDRLNAHFAECRRVLNAGEQAGRRLDFLMQELNREANTLSSKSADLRQTNAAVELKVLIDQMREQIQNIE